jgi:hypothetical protein
MVAAVSGSFKAEVAASAVAIAAPAPATPAVTSAASGYAATTAAISLIVSEVAASSSEFPLESISISIKRY